MKKSIPQEPNSWLTERDKRRIPLPPKGREHPATYLSEQLSVLGELAAQPEPPYWLCADSSETYCLDCIKTMNPNGEHGDYYEGGFECTSDSPENCENCGKLLAYALTDYGTQQELAHFVDYGFDLSSSTECYEIMQVGLNLVDNEDKIKLIKILIEINSTTPST